MQWLTKPKQRTNTNDAGFSGARSGRYGALGRREQGVLTCRDLSFVDSDEVATSVQGVAAARPSLHEISASTAMSSESSTTWMTRCLVDVKAMVCLLHMEIPRRGS